CRRRRTPPTASRANSSPRPATADEQGRLTRAPGADRRARGGGRVLSDRRGLGAPGVRRERRPLAAVGGLRRPAVRLDGGRRERLRRRPAGRPRADADSRGQLADLHRHRLLVRAPARAARPAGGADAAAGGRGGGGRLHDRLLADRVPARRRRSGEPGAGAPDRAGRGGGHDRRPADVGDRPPVPRGSAARRSTPPSPARVHDRRLEPALASMSAFERVRPSDPRLPVSPQLALRVAILGGLAVTMFAIIFFRLWYLQVLSGERYVQQANANRARDLPIAAPRGQILDRDGQPIVTIRTANAVQIVPSALPPPGGARRLALYRRLGALLGMRASRIEALVVKGRTALPYAPVTIKTDAGQGVLTVLAERQNAFPGVTQQPITLRSYPYGEMAAQVL